MVLLALVLTAGLTWAGTLAAVCVEVFQATPTGVITVPFGIIAVTAAIITAMALT